jgi:hypothetical protein
MESSAAERHTVTSARGGRAGKMLICDPAGEARSAAILLLWWN